MTQRLVSRSRNLPEHWCTVPGRENTNCTLKEWRRITLPITRDSRGEEKYSSCQLFDLNFDEIQDWENWDSSFANVTFGAILATCASILSPYLVYLGTNIDIICPYYILGILFVIATAAALFLPETLHKKLPDIMEEARQFGVLDVSLVSEKLKT